MAIDYYLLEIVFGNNDSSECFRDYVSLTPSQQVSVILLAVVGSVHIALV